MARQCIYCGRSLQPGEACTCRSGPEPKAQAAKAAGTGTNTSGAAGGKSATGGSGEAGGPTKAKSKPKASSRPKTDWKKKFRTAGAAAGSRRAGPSDGLALRMKALLRQYARFLRAPIDTALEFADDPGYAGILLLVGIEAVAAAILATVGRGSVFYLSFTMLGMTMQGASSVWTVALLAAVQSFVRLGILSGVFYVYIRFVVKRRVAFQSIVASVAPACAPMAVLMLLACLSAVNATSLATLTVVLGLLAGFLLMYFTFRRLIGLSDNQTVLMLLFGHLLYYSVLSLLIGSLSLLA